MLKKIAVSTILFAGIAAGVFFGFKYLYQTTDRQIDLPSLITTGRLESVSPAEELLPPPLSKRLTAVSQEKSLASKEVIDLTNKERVAQGLPALKENFELNKAAELKLQDMVDRQYFEHESPTGEGPSDLANRAGYAYILVGENLAEGDFTSSADLVQGWMDSPGHRANILNAKFSEIGVAVRKDSLFGRNVWIAVQEFGRPLSSCPSVDEPLKAKIDQEQAQASVLENEIQTLQTQLEQAKQSGNTSEYNSLVPTYNQKVNSYNLLVEQLKTNIATYNESVKKFNSCIAN